MYLIHINEKNSHLTKFERVVGDFPYHMLGEHLKKGNNVLVISLYSNTIKVPHIVVENGEEYWEFEDFHMDSSILKYNPYFGK